MVKRTKKRNNPRTKIRKRRNHNGRKLSKRRNHKGRKLSKKKNRMRGGAVDADGERFTYPYIGLKGSNRRMQGRGSDQSELNDAIRVAQEDVNIGDGEHVNPGQGGRPDDLNLGRPVADGGRRGQLFPDDALRPSPTERAEAARPSQRGWLEEVRLIDAASVEQAFTRARPRAPNAEPFLDWTPEIREIVRRLQNKRLFVGQHFGADDELYPNLVKVYIPTAVGGLGPYELTDREEEPSSERREYIDDGFNWSDGGDGVLTHPQRWVD